MTKTRSHLFICESIVSEEDREHTDLVFGVSGQETNLVHHANPCVTLSIVTDSSLPLLQITQTVHLQPSISSIISIIQFNSSLIINYLSKCVLGP